MAKSDERIFRALSLKKVYRTGVELSVCALDDVSLELFAGELIVLLGPSGSGKSTLLNILGGLDTPTSGTLYYRGQNITHASSRELTAYRRNSIGFIFQFYNLIPSLTALENVRLITDIAKEPMDPEEALGMVGLANRANHFPSQLSGGEQQRIAIARAIAKRPEVLLSDEPTGALDVNTGILVLSAIEKVNRELGTLAVIITHNVVISQMADRVIHLKDGKITSIEKNRDKRPVKELAW